MDVTFTKASKFLRIHSHQPELKVTSKSFKLLPSLRYFQFLKSLAKITTIIPGGHGGFEVKWLIQIKSKKHQWSHVFSYKGNKFIINNIFF